jgi:hypothetical protein
MPVKSFRTDKDVTLGAVFLTESIFTGPEDVVKTFRLQLQQWNVLLFRYTDGTT